MAGMMSGTSRDGLDLAICDFTLQPGGRYTFTLRHAHTIPYSQHPQMLERICRAEEMSAPELLALHHDWACMAAAELLKLPEELRAGVALIGCHGPTVYHTPAAGISFQLGSGATLYARTGIPAVTDFRSVDIAHGGQGAPLVPLGEVLLFPEYDAWLNLGGIANMTARMPNSTQVAAADICACNILMNEVCLQSGHPAGYDEGGALARSGQVNAALLATLVNSPLYNGESLHRDKIMEMLWPPIANAGLSPADTLATLCAHTAELIARAARRQGVRSMLATGGGAFNSHLIAAIEQRFGHTLRLPTPEIIDMKEAIIFALLALRRALGLTTTLCGPRPDCGGALYGAFAAA